MWMKDQQLMGVDLSQLDHEEFTPFTLNNCLHINNKESVRILDASFPEPLKDATKWVSWRKLLVAASQTVQGEQQAPLACGVLRPRTGKPTNQQTLTRDERICWNALHIGMPFTNDNAKVFTMMQCLLAHCLASHLLTRHEKKRNAAGAWHDLNKLLDRSGKVSKWAMQVEQLLKNAVHHDNHTKPFGNLVAVLKSHWATLEEAKQPVKIETHRRFTSQIQTCTTQSKGRVQNSNK